MGFLLFSLALSALLIGLAAWIAHSDAGAAGVCGLASGIVFLSCLLFSPALLLQGVLMFLAAAVCLGLRARPKVVVASCLGAAVLSYGIVIGLSRQEIRDLAQLRKDYPLESVAARLAYENQAPVSASEEKETRPPLSEEVEQRLVELEERDGGNVRQYALRALHERTADEFVRAAGFGVGRMLRVHREFIERPMPAPEPLPPLSEPDYNPDDPALAPLANRDRPPPAEDALLSLHTAGLHDFLDRDRMGYVRDREHVAGFEPHQFQSVPAVYSKEPEAAKWQLTRLELVSLLKHAEPAVYVSERLPRMDELDDAPTRPLAPFETTALERLRREEDLVIDQGQDRIRMLGSIRAGNDCLECHAVRRGELLGAFSYELAPLRLKRPTPPKQSEPPQA